MRRYIGEILVEMGVCSELEINDALAKQMDSDTRPIGEILIEAEACSAEDVARAMAEQHDVRYVDLEAMDIPPAVGEMVARDIAQDNKLIPVARRDNILTVAMVNPLDLGAIDNLRFSTGLQIEPAVASEAQIEKALEEVWGVSESSLDSMLGEMTEDIAYRMLDEEGDDETDDAPVIRFVTQIIQNAISADASDIHVEPMADRLQIRYRIDGVCVNMDPAPKRLQGPVIQRLKIMAGLMVEEKRRPQDGRIKAKIGEKAIDLRVSTLPAVYGESVVMRLLDSESLKLSLNDMGFDPTDYKVYEGLIKRPNGILLVVGPTGSGKTTTLYATLHTLNTTDRKIITAEDPVEYHLNGINQCQVSAKIGLNFPKILRSMLRQAPNVILVGEIRDTETANIAINASLTGHLVFSTLHTNDAPSAITRLIDMGVPPFLVATSIQGVLAQRLIRINCSSCEEAFQPEAKELIALNITEDKMEGRVFKHGAGCAKCSDTGYKGRRGIFELMVMTKELRELTFESASTDELRKAAMAGGMHTIAMDGVRKVLQGVTTPEEILRVARIES